MRVSPEEVAEGVHRIADGAVNWYIVEEDGRVALYDAGWPRSWSRVEEALAALSYDPGSVEAVVLTHGHPDHLGAAEDVRVNLGARVLAHEPEVDRVKGQAPGSSPWTLVPGLSLQLWRPPALGFVLGATVRGFLMPKWVKEVESFASDATLDVPGRPRVIPTPGHTEGHVSFELSDRGVLIAGDAIVTRDPVTGAPGPCLTHDTVASSPDQVRRSLGNLESSTADVLATGHGDPWRGSMREAVAAVRERDS